MSKIQDNQRYSPKVGGFWKVPVRLAHLFHGSGTRQRVWLASLIPRHSKEEGLGTRLETNIPTCYSSAWPDRRSGHARVPSLASQTQTTSGRIALSITHDTLGRGSCVWFARLGTTHGYPRVSDTYPGGLCVDCL